MIDHQLLFSPHSLVSRLHRIEGQDLIPRTGDSLIDEAVAVAEEWTDRWDSDQGFGSSDSIFAMKDYLDRLIDASDATNLKTAFTPLLSVIVKA